MWSLQGPGGQRGGLHLRHGAHQEQLHTADREAVRAEQGRLLLPVCQIHDKACKRAEARGERRPDPPPLLQTQRPTGHQRCRHRRPRGLLGFCLMVNGRNGLVSVSRYLFQPLACVFPTEFREIINKLLFVS
jgi:hypothetical protein